MLVKAFVLAYMAHRGQKDKAGKPYILHPVNVAKRVKGKERKIVALLHDIVEDTEITLDKLEKMGFGDEIVEAVKAITKIKGENYEDYLKRVKNNDIAKDVKLADLAHNSDLNRLKAVSIKDIKRAKKYCIAMRYLTSRGDFYEFHWK